MKALIVPILLLSSISHADIDFTQLRDRVVNLTSQMITVDTTNGNETAAALIMKNELDQAGIPNVLVGPQGRQTLVARLKGNGSKKAMMIMAHSDVVPSAGQPWDADTPPHKPTLKTVDGVEYLYGRGSLDDLSYGAIAAELMIEQKKSGQVLDRDLVLMFEADEETGGHQGAEWVLENRIDLLQDVEFALNEGGFVFTDANGNPSIINIAAAEKVYMDYKITVNNVIGGPSWRAVRPNAIFYISRGISLLYDINYPAILTPLTREYLRTSALAESRPNFKSALVSVANSSGQPAQADLDLLYTDPGYNGVLHTTCAPTIFNAGIAPNVLNVTAEANVNCRVMPGTPLQSIQDGISAAMGQDVELKPLLETAPNSTSPYIQIQPDFRWGAPSPMSPLDSPVVTAINQVAEENYAGVPVVPSLLQAASDARWTRLSGINTYGVGIVFITPTELGRVHGANERVPTAGIAKGAQFFQRVIQKVAASVPSPLLAH